MAKQSLAIKYTVDNIYDYIELTDEYSVFEMPMIKEWIGKTIIEANVRKEYGINIIAIKNGGHMNPSPEPEYVFKEGDHIIVIGKAKDVLKISAKTSKKK